MANVIARVPADAGLGSTWLAGKWRVIVAPMVRTLVLVVAGLTLAAPSAMAQSQEPSSLGEFGDWAAYTYMSSQGKVCYAVTRPKSSEPEGASRDPIFFLISHFPKQGIRNEVSTIIGYPFKKESTAQVAIGDESFELFTSGDGAWADTAAKDREIVATLKKGKTMEVKGLSWRGTSTVDHYSLQGATAAADKIDEACKP
jgi:Invasion associated locus B (IalB) protein